MDAVADAPTEPMSGGEYFRRCLGASYAPVAGIGRHAGTHPNIVAQAYQAALIECPLAADVIAALVFRLSVRMALHDFSASAL